KARQHAATLYSDSTYTDPSWLTLTWTGGRISGIPTSFTPSLHAATHRTGGGDAVSLDAAQTTTGTFALARIPTIPYSSLSGTPSLFYQSVQANSVSLTQRPTVNFIQGTNVTLSCVDNLGALSSDCTISATAGAGGYSQIMSN